MTLLKFVKVLETPRKLILQYLRWMYTRSKSGSISFVIMPFAAPRKCWRYEDIPNEDFPKHIFPNATIQEVTFPRIFFSRRKLLDYSSVGVNPYTWFFRLSVILCRVREKEAKRDWPHRRGSSMQLWWLATVMRGTPEGLDSSAWTRTLRLYTCVWLQPETKGETCLIRVSSEALELMPTFNVSILETSLLDDLQIMTRTSDQRSEKIYFRLGCGFYSLLLLQDDNLFWTIRLQRIEGTLETRTSRFSKQEIRNNLESEQNNLFWANL